MIHKQNISNHKLNTEMNRANKKTRSHLLYKTIILFNISDSHCTFFWQMAPSDKAFIFAIYKCCRIERGRIVYPNR